MAIVSISQAAKLVRKGRQTLYNHNQKGILSFTKTVDGKPGIDTSELERVYGKLYMPADKVMTAVNDNIHKADKSRQLNELKASVNHDIDTKLSKPVSMDADTVSTLSWFIDQVDETKKQLANTKEKLVEREQTLTELRKAIAVLPSPETVERRLAEQANRLERQHNEIIEAERGQLAQVLSEQRQRATRESQQWQQSLADRKIEIQQARAEVEESRQREAEQAIALKKEQARIVALESRGFFARMFNKKPSIVGQ